MPAPQEAEPGKGGFEPLEGVQRTPCAASPPPRGWGPPSREVGTQKGGHEQGDMASVPTAPTVPTENMKVRSSAAADAHVCAWYEWGERAAWLEFGCGLDRTTAERQATAERLSRAGAGG